MQFLCDADACHLVHPSDFAVKGSSAIGQSMPDLRSGSVLYFPFPFPFPFPSSLAYHCTRTPRAKDSELFEIDNLNDKVNTVNNAKFSASTYSIAGSDTFPNSPCTALLVHRTISGAIDEAVRVRAAAELSLPALELQHLPQIYLRPPGNLQPPQPSEY